jgi:hypothetical protein
MTEKRKNYSQTARDNGWNEKDEMRTIDMLGHTGGSAVNRIDYINGYLSAIKKRTEWLGMDYHVIKNHAEKALRKEQQTQALIKNGILI